MRFESCHWQLQNTSLSSWPCPCQGLNDAPNLVDPVSWECNDTVASPYVFQSVLEGFLSYLSLKSSLIDLLYSSTVALHVNIAMQCRLAACPTFQLVWKTEWAVSTNSEGSKKGPRWVCETSGKTLLTAMRPVQGIAKLPFQKQAVYLLLSEEIITITSRRDCLSTNFSSYLLVWQRPKSADEAIAVADSLSVGSRWSLCQFVSKSWNMKWDGRTLIGVNLWYSQTSTSSPICLARVLTSLRAEPSPQTCTSLAATPCKARVQAQPLCSSPSNCTIPRSIYSLAYLFNHRTRFCGDGNCRFEDNAMWYITVPIWRQADAVVWEDAKGLPESRQWLPHQLYLSKASSQWCRMYAEPQEPACAPDLQSASLIWRQQILWHCQSRSINHRAGASKIKSRNSHQKLHRVLKSRQWWQCSIEPFITLDLLKTRLACLWWDYKRYQPRCRCRRFPWPTSEEVRNIVQYLQTSLPAEHLVTRVIIEQEQESSANSRRFD